MPDAADLTGLDHAHLWHPFTPMQQWRQQPPLIIERGDGPYLIDSDGRRYIDGVSSLWCNVHGHNVPYLNAAVRDQLDKIAHTTLLGLASPPSTELAGRLADITPAGLNKVFYSDAGATAVEVACKMAVGYWFHGGRGEKNGFIAFSGAYHGDTTGAMSVGYSESFHRPFASMVFPVTFVPAPGASTIVPGGDCFASDDEHRVAAAATKSLDALAATLEQQADQTAAVIIEPVMQGAAGMICQPPGFVAGVRELATKHDLLMIADEVATGFGRTGAMFACEHDEVAPDIMCLAKGITGGYLPLAATLCTDDVEQAFCGPIGARRTLYHGHTYTGNPLGCAAALASLDLFGQTNLLAHIRRSAAIITDRLAALQSSNHVLDIRQRGIMVGIELGADRAAGRKLDPDEQPAARLCLAMREKGLIIRPLGDVIVLMPIPAMPHDVLNHMLDIVIESVLAPQPLAMATQST